MFEGVHSSTSERKKKEKKHLLGEPLYERKQLLPFSSIKKSSETGALPSTCGLKNLIAFIGILSNWQVCRGAELAGGGRRGWLVRDPS